MARLPGRGAGAPATGTRLSDRDSVSLRRGARERSREARLQSRRADAGARSRGGLFVARSGRHREQPGRADCGQQTRERRASEQPATEQIRGRHPRPEGRGQRYRGDRPAWRVNVEERRDGVRVEAPAGLPREHGEPFLLVARQPVGPLRGDRVEGVGDGDDASAQGDLLAAQAIRVAAAVNALVVVANDRREARIPHRREHVRAVGGVTLDHLELLVGEGAGLVEDRRWRVDLADVVDQRRGPHLCTLGGADVQRSGDAFGVVCHAAAMTVGVGVARLQQPAEALEQLDPWPARARARDRAGVGRQSRLAKLQSIRSEKRTPRAQRRRFQHDDASAAKPRESATAQASVVIVPGTPGAAIRAFASRAGSNATVRVARIAAGR